MIDRFSDNSRFWGTFGRDIDLGALGRFRGNLRRLSLPHLERLARSPTSNRPMGPMRTARQLEAGRCRSRYLVRGAVGNYRADHYRKDHLERPVEPPCSRRSPVASPDHRRDGGTDANSGLSLLAEPIVPGLTLNTNLNSSLARYGTGPTRRPSASAAPPPAPSAPRLPRLHTTVDHWRGNPARRQQSLRGRAVDLGTLGSDSLSRLSAGGVKHRCEPEHHPAPTNTGRSSTPTSNCAGNDAATTSGSISTPMRGSVGFASV